MFGYAKARRGLVDSARDRPPAVSAPQPVIEATISPEITVLIVYADPVISAGLSTLLGEHRGFRLLRSATGESTDRVLETSAASADIVIADYDSGIQLSAAAAQSNGRVVIFTPNDGEASIRHAFARGVRGYLLLGCTPLDLVTAVRSVHEGAVAVTPRVASRIAESMNHKALSPREQTVLRLVILGHRNKKIARECGLTEGTVKAHVKSILGKLKACSRSEAVAVARRRGILPEETSDQGLRPNREPTRLRRTLEPSMVATGL